MPSYFYHIKFEVYPTPHPSRRGSVVGHGTGSRQTWLLSTRPDAFARLPSLVRNGHDVGQAEHPSRPPTQAPPPPPPTTTRQQQRENNSVIDCGAPRPSGAGGTGGRSNPSLAGHGHRPATERAISFPPPSSYSAVKPQTAARDWRFARLWIESVHVDVVREDMPGSMAAEPTAATAATAASAVGPSVGSAGKATKARYVPTSRDKTDLGWGIVHLYREGEETPALSFPPQHGAEQAPDLDCTTLCIPAVPSYLSPNDFLGFVGDRWREQISHYRMVMTERMNRYLVLLKFRDGKRARLFRREFDGRVFNDIEASSLPTPAPDAVRSPLTTARVYSPRRATSPSSGPSPSRPPADPTAASPI